MKKFLLIISVFFISIYILLAQNTGEIWYFGQYAGLNFNQDSIQVLTNSSLNTHEGCATLYDVNGNLVFYTNGCKVWNRNHNQMPNGDSLMGSKSSTQSAIIIPKPGNNNICYIFTVCVKDSTLGFRYSVVDLTLDNNLGDVTNEKNILLHNSTTEKLTAVKHSNRTDYWVITHDWNSNAFRSYLVTSSGIDPSPVISNVGVSHSGSEANKIGYLIASPDGDKLALAISVINTFELFDFDNSSGLASNPISLQSSQYFMAYGVEFSPDGSKLYVSKRGVPSKLYQYDLQAGSPNAITKSVKLITTLDNIKENEIGALKLGPDGKIYVAKKGMKYLGVIRNPNALGTKCDYVDDNINLDIDNAGRLCRLGLPFTIACNICDVTAFDYPDFNSVENLLFVPAAEQVDSVVRLSYTDWFIRGAMWHENEIPVKNGFTTTFKFSFTEGKNNTYEDGSLPGADGIAFVIQNHKPDIIGTAGYGIGYDQIKNSLAVEFDTFANDSTQWDDMHDPNGNHIAVQSNGRDRNSTDHGTSALLGYADDIIEITPDGTVYHAKIDYNVVKNTLRVYLDTSGKFESPSLVVPSIKIDDLLELENGEYAWVGFTSATGNAWENHDLLSWYMCPAPADRISGVEQADIIIDKKQLRNYPNPFSERTTIEFSIDKPGYVSLKIANILGEVVDEALSEYLPKGDYKVDWEVGNCDSGMYYYILQAGEKIISGKLILIR